MRNPQNAKLASPPWSGGSTAGLGSEGWFCFLTQMDYRTKAEFYSRGIAGGFIDAAEVIAWSDEVIVSAPKAEDWMVEISSCSPDERLKVLGFLNTVKGVVDEAALAEMLKARG